MELQTGCHRFHREYRDDIYGCIFGVGIVDGQIRPSMLQCYPFNPF
jgi:hypothetical protein